MCTIIRNVFYIMRIYTSYFANIKTLEENNIYPVGICNKVPQFFENPNLESVAPSNSILYEYKNSAQTDADREHYKERYINEILCAYRFHPEYLTERLEYFSSQEDDKDIALVCYERPEDFCHRHILAEWLNERLGDKYIIEEYPKFPQPTEKKEKKKKDTIIIKSNPLF